MSAGKGLEKPFDAEAFKKDLLGRIKKEFFDGLPDAMFGEMVEESMERFLKHDRVKNPEWTQYNNKPKTIKGPSEFDQAVHGILSAWIKKECMAYFSTEEWVGNWNSMMGQNSASEMVKEMLIEAAPAMLAAMMGGAAQHVVEQFRQQLGSGQQY